MPQVRTRAAEEKKRDASGPTIGECLSIPGFAALLASDNSRNWRHRKHVPWKHVGPLLLSANKRRRGTPPALDLGSIYLLIPEEVVHNVTQQTLWRLLAIIWKNRHRNQRLFDSIETQMQLWADTLSREIPPGEQEQQA